MRCSDQTCAHGYGSTSLTRRTSMKKIGGSHMFTPEKSKGLWWWFLFFVFLEKNRLSQIFPKFPLWVSGFKTHPGVHFIVSHLTQKLGSEDLFPTNHLTITLPLISHYYTVTIPSLYTITIYHHYTITIPSLYPCDTVTIPSIYCYYTVKIPLLPLLYSHYYNTAVTSLT